MDFVFETVDRCDACPRDTPFLMKKHVSRAGFMEMAGKRSADTLFRTEKSVSRQRRGPSVKWPVLRMGDGRNVGLSAKRRFIRMGGSQNVRPSAKSRFLRTRAFQNRSDGDEM